MRYVIKTQKENETIYDTGKMCGRRNLCMSETKWRIYAVFVGLALWFCCSLQLSPVADASSVQDTTVLTQDTMLDPDTIAPKLSASYSVMNQKAVVKVKAKDAQSGLAKLVWIKGDIQKANSSKWASAKDILADKQFTVTKKGTYSILAQDAMGNTSIFNLEVIMEMKAVWVSFLEYSPEGYTEKSFKRYVNTILDTCVTKHLNTVIFHVRPFADAMYDSSYFPWSKYASGKAGKNPGFDPLKYAVDAAHKRGLSIQAWINPYRITGQGTSTKSLPKGSIARKWKTSKSSSVRRRVLAYEGKLYFNPASTAVQKLIVNGVKEIVEKYDIDGVHFDDYFYPNLGSRYKKNFDAKEYKAYVKKCAKQKKKAMTIVKWRRKNIDNLVKKTYAAVKKADKNCVFGISPAGNIDNLYAKNNYYCDVKKWMNSDKYIDYICPQIYWSFTQKTCPYKKTLKRWLDIPRSNSVNMYVGLAAYRAGISKKEAVSITDKEWAKKSDILKRQVTTARDTGKVDGFVLFSYQNLTSKSAKKEMKNLMKVINKR